MTTVIARQVLRAAIVTGPGMIFAVAVHAGGPQVTMYITVPLDGRAHSHVFGLRLDKEAAPPDIRVINPSSPLNRRALLDLQMGADSALRLDLDRRLTWDFNRQQWRQSSLPATFTLRVPTREPASRDANTAHEEPVTRLASSSPVDHSSLLASLNNPFQNQTGKPLVKPLAVEP